MAEVIITKDNFQSEVMQSNVPVLIDFWATWCGPCKMIAPVVEEIAQEYDGRVKVGKVDVDEESELAMSFGIQSIPTLLVVKDGKTVETLVGYRPKAALSEMLDKHL
ncbi:MAG: thioredoxin [Clostridia bacterium]|nr:thioredoxin [Clostridia bacterium]